MEPQLDKFGRAVVRCDCLRGHGVRVPNSNHLPDLRIAQRLVPGADEVALRSGHGCKSPRPRRYKLAFDRLLRPAAIAALGPHPHPGPAAMLRRFSAERPVPQPGFTPEHPRWHLC